MAAAPAAAAAELALALVPVPACGHGEFPAENMQVFVNRETCYNAGRLTQLGPLGCPDQTGYFAQSLADGWDWGWFSETYFMRAEFSEISVRSHPGKNFSKWVFVACMTCKKACYIYHQSEYGLDDLQLVLGLHLFS